MPGCLTSASPFLADCQLVGTLWSYVVMSAIWSALAYAVVVARPTGVRRYLRGVAAAFVVAALLEPFAELLAYGRVVPVYAVYSAAVTVAACFAWRKRKSSVPVAPRAKARFDLGEYAFITMLLLAGQSALALLHVKFSSPEATSLGTSRPLPSSALTASKDG